MDRPQLPPIWHKEYSRAFDDLSPEICPCDRIQLSVPYSIVPAVFQMPPRRHRDLEQNLKYEVQYEEAALCAHNL